MDYRSGGMNGFVHGMAPHSFQDMLSINSWRAASSRVAQNSQLPPLINRFGLFSVNALSLYCEKAHKSKKIQPQIRPHNMVIPTGIDLPDRIRV